MAHRKKRLWTNASMARPPRVSRRSQSDQTGLLQPPHEGRDDAEAENGGEEERDDAGALVAEHGHDERRRDAEEEVVHATRLHRIVVDERPGSP